MFDGTSVTDTEPKSKKYISTGQNIAGDNPQFTVTHWPVNKVAAAL